jgi:glycosyltransferase involved in cell wall biosynthesis
MATRDTSQKCYCSVCYCMAERFDCDRRWMISSAVAIRSWSVYVRECRLNSTGFSMPSRDIPPSPNCKGGRFTKKITIIIPSYNNRQSYERNLSSVVAQDYSDYRVIYVDDCSSDKTGELVEQFITDSNSGNLIQLIRNPARVGALQNLYNAIRMCEDDEIVILLDGDDWLAHNGVLTKLNGVYGDLNCWMTYGQYRSWPDNMIGFSKEIPPDIIEANNFRENEWCSSHLRSFYAWLFKLIKMEDLISPCGGFYNMAWDQAVMFPMLEMSGHRAKFLSEVLYVYNSANPISDCKVDRHLQRSLETVIRTQKRYDRLK